MNNREAPLLGLAKSIYIYFNSLLGAPISPTISWQKLWAYSLIPKSQEVELCITWLGGIFIVLLETISIMYPTSFPGSTPLLRWRLGAENFAGGGGDTRGGPRGVYHHFEKRRREDPVDEVVMYQLIYLLYIDELFSVAWIVPFFKISRKYPVLESNCPLSLSVGCVKTLSRSLELWKCLGTRSLEDLEFAVTGIPCTILEEVQDNTKYIKTICWIKKHSHQFLPWLGKLRAVFDERLKFRRLAFDLATGLSIRDHFAN